ncbi:MAG: hypothetical protein AAF871_15140 [Pseudomonadota bacterium]
MGPIEKSPNARLRWLDDLLVELEKFTVRYDLPELQSDFASARKTLEAECVRIEAIPSHPIHRSHRGLPN